MDNVDIYNSIDKVCKYNNIKILKADYIEGGGKINSASNIYQFNIGNEYKKDKYSFGTIGVEDFLFTEKEVLEKLEGKLIELAENKSIQFVNLALPKMNVEFSEMADCHNIIIRHLIDYLPMSDILCERRDILIKVI